MKQLLALTVLVFGAMGGPPVPAVASPTDDLVTTEVSFTGSGGVILHGSVVAPVVRNEPLPAMVLVHGGGAGPRAWLRQEAETFARAGMVTLIYDKRTDGYSLVERSFSQLAQDALAAHEVLRGQAGVDPARVGLWGVSEGGWVAPLAATRSERVAFVVTVGASGVAPARQEAWAKANRLRAAGVAGSMLRAYPVTAVALLTGAGLFPESEYDPIPPLTRLRQPILAIWGAHDELSPPAESMAIFDQALIQARNARFSLRVLPDGDHAGYLATDGGFAVQNWITPEGQFATGYVGLIQSWVRGLADPAASVDRDARPEQATTSAALPSHWYAHLGVFLLLFAGFATYLLLGIGRRRPVVGPARWLAVGGAVVVSGLFAYVAALLMSSEQAAGPVVLGRPVVWLVLQLMAVLVVGAGIATAVVWWRVRAEIGGLARVRLGLLGGTAAAFVPWALGWGLLLP
ncbi:prolyl oligopeptidase family serine peptidase [Actinoplanes sp. NPDC051633]|uniref:alpha/beta hydrolase family protein n=1 Tax=Actinoplanes sp. NPDC051633 TaxID=3155670 RepID=UPI0034481841